MGEFQSIILVVESFDVYDTLDLGVLAFEMDVTLLWNCSLLKKKEEGEDEKWKSREKFNYNYSSKHRVRKFIYFDRISLIYLYINN